VNPQEVLAEGGVKAERHQWAAAMKRAAGEKVLDDPKLLKRSLKREAKRKEKSAATWAQKEKEQKEARDAKQNKRQTNLKVPCRACSPHVSVVSAYKLCRCVGCGAWALGHCTHSPAHPPALPRGQAAR
jgi:ribosomal protein S14